MVTIELLSLQTSSPVDVINDGERRDSCLIECGPMRDMGSTRKRFLCDW